MYKKSAFFAPLESLITFGQFCFPRIFIIASPMIFALPVNANSSDVASIAKKNNGLY